MSSNPTEPAMLAQRDHVRRVCIGVGVLSFISFIISIPILTSDPMNHNNNNNNPDMASEYSLSTQNHSGHINDSASFFSNFSEKLTSGDPWSVGFLLCASVAFALIIKIAKGACSSDGLGEGKTYIPSKLTNPKEPVEMKSVISTTP